VNIFLNRAILISSANIWQHICCRCLCGGRQGSSMYSISRFCQTVLRCGYTNLNFATCTQIIRLLYRPARTWHYFLFHVSPTDVCRMISWLKLVFLRRWWG
jgi:hypothetical protein